MQSGLHVPLPSLSWKPPTQPPQTPFMQLRWTVLQSKVEGGNWHLPATHDGGPNTVATDPVHVGPAGAWAKQLLPQAPQFDGSTDVSVQFVPH
jgi:hypothetical protein